MIENGFLKINIEGFHSYLDKVGDVIDIFYKKKKDEPVNFTLQNHKIILLKPSINIDRIEIDHKSIFLSYNKNDTPSNAVTYFTDIVNDVFGAVKYKCSTFTRIGHAINFTILDEKEIDSIKSKIFSAKNVTIKNFNDLLIEVPVKGKKAATQKILSTPLDTQTAKNILLLNIDYYSTESIANSDAKDFLNDSVIYLENKRLEGLYDS